MNAITQAEIDQQVFSLYDEYCHGRIDRREFLKRAGALGALGFAISLLPDYARAQTISFTDTRIKAQYVTYPSPGGNAASLRGYLVHPVGQGPFPAVLVVHENRGLNPYIEDVARRAAVEGFVALAPDGLGPVGGYPGNDDDGRELQAKLDQAKLRTDMHAGAPYYGVAAATADVSKIKAPLLVHLAENDPRVNETYPTYEQELKKTGARYEIHMYPGTQHGFHNNSTPRYNEPAAKLSWERTVAFFKRNLA